MFSRLLLLVPVTILACVTPAQAQTYVWNGPLTGTTNWSAGLWSPGTPPSGGGTGVALFFTGTNGSYVATNNLGNPFVLNSMEFGQRFTASTSISGSVPSSIQLGGADPFIGIPVVGAIEANGNSVSISSSISLNASSGTATLGSQGKGVLLIAGNISGTGPVSLVGNNNAVNWSYLRLAGSNSFIGGVTLDGGHVILGSSSALGAAANTLTVNSGWISSTVSSLTIGNAVTLNGDLQFMGTGANLIMTGLLSGNGGVRVSGLTSGTTVLDVRATNTYSGQTVIDTAPIFGQSTNSPVNNGSLNVATATGSLLNTSGVIVRSGTLFLNDSAASTVTGGRINDAASITLGSGVLNVLIGSSGSYNEVVDGLILESGHSSVSLTPQPSTAAQLSFSTLTRQNRATALFRGASLGNTPGANVATVSFSTPPVADLIGGGGAAGTTTISILPYAYGHTTSSGLGNSLVTLTSGRIRPLVFATEYAGTMVGGTSSTENVRLTSNFNLSTASLTVRNSLTLNSGTLSNSGGGALRLTSGTILFTLSSTISAPLDFGSQEAIILSSAASTISGSIAGSGGLTKGGPANLTLSGVNSYSGTTTINGGLILFSSPTAFGNSNLIQAGGANADLTTIDRAGLTYTGATAAVLPQDIVLRSGLFALNATNANGSLRLDGQVSGSGGLFINTTGNVILTNNNNNYTGQTRIFTGNLVFGSEAQLGSGALDLGSVAGQGIILTDNWTANRHVNISANSQINTQEFNWTQNGNFTGTQAATLTKVGTGTWTLNSDINNSTFAGPVTISAGRFMVNGFLATSTSSLTIANGAGLGGGGEIDRPVTVGTNAVISPGASTGTLAISTRSATALTIGAGTTFEIEINNATGTIGVNWDRLIALHAPISLPNALTIQLIGLDAGDNPGPVANFNPGADYTWEFLTAPNFTGTAFNSIAFTLDVSQFIDNNPLAGGTFSIVQVGSTGIAVQFVAAIPEPTTCILLGAFALSAAGYTWHRRQRRAVDEILAE